MEGVENILFLNNKKICRWNQEGGCINTDNAEAGYTWGYVFEQCNVIDI